MAEAQKRARTQAQELLEANEANMFLQQKAMENEAKAKEWEKVVTRAQEDSTIAKIELQQAQRNLEDMKKAVQEKEIQGQLQLQQLEQQMAQDRQAHASQMQRKENMLKAMTVCQDLNKRRLEQAEATINEFLANPMAGTSDESAKDAEIAALKKQVEMDRLLQATMVSGWVAREAAKDREIEELKVEVQRLKAAVAEGASMDQGRPNPSKPTSAEHVTFEPLEEDIPWTSAQAGDEAEEIDYTIAQPSTSEPRENDIEE